MAQQFKKGDDPRRNRNGRPKGKPNRSTEEMRQFIADLLYENKDRIRDAIKTVDDDKLLMVFDRLLKHYLPAPQDELMRLSDEDLDKLIDRLKARALDNSRGNKDLSN